MVNFLAAAALAILAAMADARAADGPVAGNFGIRTAQNTPTMGWCHDAERNLVSRRPIHRCRGRIVDEAEAQSLRRDRERLIRRAVQGGQPVAPGTGGRGSGSGFVVSTAGHVLTNYHVVDGCRRVSVIPAGRPEAAASVVAVDVALDLALLNAPIDVPEPARFGDAAGPQPAADIAVIGYPERGLLAVQPVLETGHVYVGGVARRADRFLMKIDVRRGNSGGPVLDRGGRVVGVVVAKIDTPAVYAGTGILVRDVALAIRPYVALDFLASHGVSVGPADRGEDLDDGALMARVRPVLARIACQR